MHRCPTHPIVVCPVSCIYSVRAAKVMHCAPATSRPQGLPGLLVALERQRRPLVVEAAFLSRGQAARMRAWLRGVVGRGQGGRDVNGVGAKVDEEPCVTVLSWEGYDECGGWEGWWGRAGEGFGAGGREHEGEEDGEETGSEGGGEGEGGWGGGW